MTDYFKNGTANIGGKDVAFEQRAIRGDFLMYVPKSFAEDKSIVSNYSYLFSRDKSPLSIAVKYSPVTDAAARAKMIASYFSNSPEAKFAETETAAPGILFRETVTSSQYMGVYSLRFSVEAGDGMLFGCFNCSAKYKDDWKPTVLQMLQNVEQA